MAGWTCHTTLAAPRHMRVPARERFLGLHALCLLWGSGARRAPMPALERRGETGARGRAGRAPARGCAAGRTPSRTSRPRPLYLDATRLGTSPAEWGIKRTPFSHPLLGQAKPFPFRSTRSSSTPSFTRTHPTPSHLLPAPVTMCDLLEVIYSCGHKGVETFSCCRPGKKKSKCRNPEILPGGKPLEYNIVCDLCLARTMLASVEAAEVAMRSPALRDTAP